MTKITANPKEVVKKIEGAQAFAGFLMKNGVPEATMLKTYNIMLEEILTQFKAAVQEELLESQRQTNDALAAALNMRGK